VIFTVTICEWWFRVLVPSPSHVKRALKHNLDQAGYTPHNIRLVKLVGTPRVPKIIDPYVHERLRPKWNGQASEQSRFLLKGHIPELTKEFARPFRIANFQQLPGRKHGYPWQACWASSVIVYERLRGHYQNRNDSRPIDGALELAGALLNRLVEDSQFRKCRKDILEETPGLVQRFIDQFNDFKTNGGKVEELLENDYRLHTVFPLPHNGGAISKHGGN
jgi:hypothetical protein